MHKHYEWERFWFPRGEAYPTSGDGFAGDPTTWWGGRENIKSLDELASVPCVILLGEPGAGKSTCIDQAFKATSTRVEQAGGTALLVNLRSYGSEVRFIENTFQSEKFQNWRNATRELHLFLDSLDEALLRVDTIGGILVDELRRLPVDRLRLRIACRTADWPKTLEEGLKNSWGNQQQVQAYELMPLRRCDVKIAADANGIDPDRMLRDVIGKGLQALAVRPITLEFLLRSYMKTGEMAETKSALYEEGCRQLCAEWDDRRKRRTRGQDLSTEQRLAVARRLAAITVFCNRSGVWLDDNLLDMPEEDVPLRFITGGTETAGDNPFAVDGPQIREVLGTGLFVGAGIDRMQWVHQTYAEYLAASYLVNRQVPLAQVLGLITHAEDPGKRIVPQLLEVAAWLASIRRDVFEEVLQHDPQVLLYSDTGGLREEDKPELVSRLLSLVAEKKMHDVDLYGKGIVAQLGYSGLSSQLRQHIRDVELYIAS